MSLGCSVYDATYLALVVHLDADLATADKALARAAPTTRCTGGPGGG